MNFPWGIIAFSYGIFRYFVPPYASADYSDGFWVGTCAGVGGAALLVWLVAALGRRNLR